MPGCAGCNMSDPLANFARLVRLMRHEQKEYFRTRRGDRLEECKRLEREVDEALRDMADKQRALFEKGSHDE